MRVCSVKFVLTTTHSTLYVYYTYYNIITL